MHALQRGGSEAQREEALLRLQGDGGGVPESVLKTVYETDASPRVRLLAFEYALQAHAGDAEALKRALESAQYVPDAVVAQDASKRLDSLNRELEAAGLLPPQGRERRP